MNRWKPARLLLAALWLASTLAGCASPADTPTPLTSAVATASTTATATPQPQATPTLTPTPLPLLRGLAYSPYRDCQSADTEAQPSLENVREDLQIIQGMAHAIRTYSATGINREIPALAASMGFSVSAGAWLSRDLEANEEEIAALIEIARETELESVIVGNEVLLRGDLTEEALLAYIRRVQEAVDTPVTTAEIGAVLLQHPRLMEAVDFEMVHLYPFWEGQTIDYAARLVAKSYQEIIHQSGGKRVVIGETGWPSAGPTFGAAVPNPENQRRFAREFLTIAQEEGIEYFYFDAFDEMWKTEGGVGPFWGLLTVERQFKHDVRSVEVGYGAAPQPLQQDLPALQSTAVSTAVSTALDQSSITADFVVFSTFGDALNHFAPGGYMGSITNVQANTCWRSDAPWPETVIQVTYDPDQPSTTGDWGGIYWLQPDHNWGSVPDAGFDLTGYRQLVFKARAEQPGTQVKFVAGGVSENEQATPLPYPSSILEPVFAQEADPLDGFVNLSGDWQEYHIDLTQADLSYVIDGFGLAFEQARSPAGAAIYLDDIRYVTAEPGPAPLAPAHIYSGKTLREGLDMGVDTSGNRFDMAEDLNGEMRIAYPPGQSWGVVFLTVGEPAPLGNRQWIDLSPYRTLSVEMRGEAGGEQVYIGIKDNTQRDTGKETKLPVTLAGEWQTYKFDLEAFSRADRSRLYIPIEFVFEKGIGPETIYFRNIQYLP